LGKRAEVVKTSRIGPKSATRFSDQPMPQKEGQTKKKAASIPAGREL